jgi:hypothetical protein
VYDLQEKELAYRKDVIFNKSNLSSDMFRNLDVGYIATLDPLNFKEEIPSNHGFIFSNTPVAITALTIKTSLRNAYNIPKHFKDVMQSQNLKE